MPGSGVDQDKHAGHQSAVVGLRLGRRSVMLMDEMILHPLSEAARDLRASIEAVRRSCSIERVDAKQLEGQQSGFTSFPRLA